MARLSLEVSCRLRFLLGMAERRLSRPFLPCLSSGPWSPAQAYFCRDTPRGKVAWLCGVSGTWDDGAAVTGHRVKGKRTQQSSFRFLFRGLDSHILVAAPILKAMTDCREPGTWDPRQARAPDVNTNTAAPQHAFLLKAREEKEAAIGLL